YLNAQIDGQTVAFGGSMTLKEMGLYESLGAHNTVYWHDKASSPEEREDIFKKAMGTTFYLSSVNGLAETGEIINIDATCNRVSSTLFGHEKVYLIVGKNKIAADYDGALYRARNVAAPKNAQRLGRKTPCADKADHCYDCKSPDRICCGLTVLWRKPLGCEVEVVLIDQELGY
ncbi:MAG: lactate utilization protein, partial [Bacteroidales bacterium]|nr:lactate utilization protein [Bacteroidales bacterium]